MSALASTIPFAGQFEVPGKWADDALCTQIGWPDAWFPTPGEDDDTGTRAILRICRRCPVRTDCLEYAMRHESGTTTYRYGIYGGLTPHERRKLAMHREIP